MILEEKRKKAIKSTKRAKMASVLIVLFTVLYIPSLFYWVYSGNISTDIIKYGNLEDSLNVEGFLFRNEYVLKSERTGIFFSDVNEGERVQAFAKIVSILNENNKELIKELNKKNKMLIDSHKELSQKSGVVSYEVQKVDDDISSKMEEIVLADNTNDISRIVGLKSEIETLAKKKVQIISAISIKDNNFNKIKEERNMIKKNIDANTSDVTAPSSGMVSYMVDGLESKLTFDSIKTFKPEELRNLNNNSIFMVPEDSHVTAGKPIAKIITDNEYYMVLPLSTDNAKTFKVGSEVKVRLIPINRTVSGIVNYISQDANGEQIVSIKIDRALAETSAFRKMNISIIKSSYSGYKIPFKSLMDFDPQSKKAKLMILKAGVSKLIEVTISGYNDEFAIIDNTKINFNSGLNLYDLYVLDGRSVKEGQFIN